MKVANSSYSALVKVVDAVHDIKSAMKVLEEKLLESCASVKDAYAEVLG
jgi:hypothetical protein